MTLRIEAWRDERHIGAFVFTGGAPVFEYDDDAPPTPISLSLPRDGGATKRAAAHFLENLLPENEGIRGRMASTYGAESTSALDLLAVAGGDIAGGIVLLPDGQVPSRAPAQLSPALPRDIGERIAAVKRDSSESIPRDVRARFSLAGVQGKFALARVEEDWYWPNSTVPSTHIFKPGNPIYPDIERAEAAAIVLARRAGLPASLSDVAVYAGQSTFVTRRFDRIDGEGALARRVHAEDLAQGLGIPPDKKYSVTAVQACALLASVDRSGHLRRLFVKLLAFNVLIGNADAHAKNYSLLLTNEGVSLAPMYDVVPLFLYPEVDQSLAMRIGPARFSREVTLLHWRRLARAVGMDPDDVVHEVRTLADVVGVLNEQAWSALEPGLQRKAEVFVAANVDRVLTGSRG